MTRSEFTMRLILILLSLCLLMPTQASAKAESRTVQYEGKLQDAQRKPVGGVYKLSFSLHRSAKRGKSLWTESHFVSVEDGLYALELGHKRPIPKKLKLGKLYLAVSLTGGPEIVRERVNLDKVSGVEGVRASSDAPRRKDVKVRSDAKGRSVVDYAENAGLAFEAEHAKVADKVGNMTEADILTSIRDAGGKANLGNGKRYTGSAGGDGGVQYELKCPKGHVVTGVRGGSGIYLDSIQLICSPLE